MSIVYQSTSSSRQIDGCLTPSLETKEPPRSKMVFHTNNTIPSPPLSPATNGDFDGKFAELIAPTPISLSEPFPIEDLSKSELVINAWQDLNKPGYRRRQMHFLKQYKLNPLAPAPTIIKKRFPTVRRNYYTSDDTDASSTEKRVVRTRRVVRERTTEPDESISVAPPSTPKRRRPAKTSSSPRLDSPSTPVYNYEALPDYCPSLDTLPANNKCLKTEWKGQPMNLSEDPLIDKLHPAEVVLASVLRLPGNVYLDSKRRLFAEKVSRLRKGLPFRRTDAQKACKIDVNKASRLYAAFEKVGWLQDRNFTEFL